MNNKIKNNFLVYRDYKLKCSIGKSGITSSKREGDLATPRGLYKLGLLYYRKDRLKVPRCNIRKKNIKKNMGWCNDSKSKSYNKEITFPYKYTAEKLFRRDKKYDLLIVLKYNISPVIKKKGSAIFIHLTNKTYRQTAGCNPITREDFLKILPLINNKTKIKIN